MPILFVVMAEGGFGGSGEDVDSKLTDSEGTVKLKMPVSRSGCQDQDASVKIKMPVSRSVPRQSLQDLRRSGEDNPLSVEGMEGGSSIASVGDSLTLKVKDAEGKAATFPLGRSTPLREMMDMSTGAGF